MNKEKLINELRQFTEYDTIDLGSLTETDLNDLFDTHCFKYSVEVEIGEVWETLEKSAILADTPDGWIPVGDFYKKHPRNIHELTTAHGVVKISEDHLFETSTGWKATKDISKDDLILSKDGFIFVKSNQVVSVEQVYDWEILHANHRYWVGGLSSHNTGKTFVCLNIAREAQLMGYDIIYIDTEGAIEIDALIKNFGIDPRKFRLQPIKTVGQVKILISRIIDMINESRSNGGEPKVMVFVDSLGMLATEKEISDVKKGENKMDMGLKAKELRAMFRAITLDATAAKLPIIATNHTYTNSSGYVPVKDASGGDGPIFAFSMLTFLSKKNDEFKTGILVKSKLRKSRFTQPKEIQFHIGFYSGMNPYVGLENFVSWDACGIERGKIIDEKEYSKLKDGSAEKNACLPFSSNDGESLYFASNPNATRYVIRHLGKTIFPKDLLKPDVFTAEVLKQLDDNVIQNSFKFPDRNEIENEIFIGEDEDEDGED
jgi:RecA/RadA recombinase